MLSQLLEDMRLYQSAETKKSSQLLSISTPQIDKQGYIDSLLDPSLLETENKNRYDDDSINLNLSQSIQFSLSNPQNESMNIISNRSYGDGDGDDVDDDIFRSNSSQILKLSQDISYLSQVSSSSPIPLSQQYSGDDDGDQDHNFYYEDSNSVESYSRIAGRLSLDSSSQMSG